MMHARVIILLVIAFGIACHGQTNSSSGTARQEKPVAESPAENCDSTTYVPPTGHLEAQRKPYDLSSYLSFLVAAEGSGGIDTTRFHRPTAFAGVKIGSIITLDLGYDRIHGKNGFSTEVSGMIPVFRAPGPQTNEKKNYLRVYAEPGLGYRAGGGPFGGYASAKVMFALFSDERITHDTKFSPYIEVQHRFPFNSPGQGDTRFTIGLIFADCNHCGFD